MSLRKRDFEKTCVVVAKAPTCATAVDAKVTGLNHQVNFQQEIDSAQNYDKRIKDSSNTCLRNKKSV